MELEENYSKTYNKYAPDPSGKILLHQNSLQLDKEPQANNYPTQLTNGNNSNIDKNQGQSNNISSFSFLNNDGNVKEIFKILGVLIQIVMFLLFINMTARSYFGTQTKDGGNMTYTGTFSPRLEATTLILDDENNDHIVIEEREMSLEPKEIRVPSFSEYNKEIHTIPTSVPVLLHIMADKPSDLASYTNLQRSSDIAEVTIEGCMDPNHLHRLLVQFRNVNKIVIIEKDSFKCNYRNVFMKHGQKFLFPNLKSLNFYNITSGNSIYSVFSKHFLITGVESLEISQPEITEENIIAVRTLLENVKYSLKTLHFPNVQWNSVLFQNFLCVFPNLIELRLDFLSKIDMTDNLLGTLNRNAPNLKRLVSKHGYLRYSQLSAITSLRNMESLSFGLQVPANIDHIDVSVLVRYLPLLKFLELSLSFDNPLNCKVLESDGIKQTLGISYFTECDLDIINYVKSH